MGFAYQNRQESTGLIENPNRRGFAYRQKPISFETIPDIQPLSTKITGAHRTPETGVQGRRKGIYCCSSMQTATSFLTH